MSSEYDPSEHAPSEYSNSADPSGDTTSQSRGNPPVEVERDPYDDDLEVSYPSLIRPHSTTFRGPRVITTARKSVPLPRRERLTNPPRDIGESSQRGAQSGATQVVTGVPIAHPPGMTARESQWVLFLSQDQQLHKERLDSHHEHLNAITGVLNAHHEVTDRTMEVVDATRREIRTLYMYLMGVIGALVMMLGMLIWVVTH